MANGFVVWSWSETREVRKSTHGATEILKKPTISIVGTEHVQHTCNRFIGFPKGRTSEESDGILLERSSFDDVPVDYEYSPQLVLP